MSVPVLTAGDGAAWEARVVADTGDGLVVARRCVDVVELLAVAQSGQGKAALVSGSLRRLDADAVDRLRASGVAVVAVIGRDDRMLEQRVRAMGIAYVVPDDTDAAVLVSVVEEAIAQAAAPSVPQRTFTVPVPPPPPGMAPLTPAPAEVSTRRGSVVAVWGPAGAPGRTTVAVALADELSRLSPSAMVVDADVYGGVISTVLGLLDESPGLAAACRAAGTSRLDADGLAALCWQLRPQLRVLTGIARADRWPEVRANAMSAVLDVARSVADFTVVDLGFCLETDEELSFDTLAPRRNGATLAVLDAADVIIAVGAADPVGLQRLVRGLAELRDTEVSAPVWAVFNQVRSAAVPGDTERELADALERFAGRRPAAMLPFDRDSLDAALATGQLLADVRPNSPLRARVAELAAALAGVPAPTRTGGGLRSRIARRASLSS